MAAMTGGALSRSCVPRHRLRPPRTARASPRNKVRGFDDSARKGKSNLSVYFFVTIQIIFFLISNYFFNAEPSIILVALLLH